MDFVLARVKDKIKFFDRTGKTTSTYFLTPAEILEVYPELRGIKFCLTGGYENAERRVAIIGAEEDSISDFCTVIRCTLLGECAFGNYNLKSNKKWKGKILGHRDVLGSVLGLGIKREMVGDILLSDNFCDIIIMREMKEYILSNLDNIGREKIKCEEISFEEVSDVGNLKKSKSITVASMRLDALISSVFGISREKSSELVKMEKVSIGFVLCKNVSKCVCDGDLVSVRGYGRFKVLQVSGETRKGRIKVLVEL